jgi:hypothetical protein
MSHVALTMYRYQFWVPVGRGSRAQCYEYAERVERARTENTRVVSESEWDKEQATRRRERTGR